MDRVRKKSPAAPSCSLQEALAKVEQIYKAEGLHIAPVDAAAKAMGYTSAKSGASVRALATLKMFGLLESKGSGMVSVTKSFQSYRLAPDDRTRQGCLVEFVKKPKIFAGMLSAYPDGLPSDETLKHMLVVDAGFVEGSAEPVIRDFRQSIEFAEFYVANHNYDIDGVEARNAIDVGDVTGLLSGNREDEETVVKASNLTALTPQISEDYDTPIPVRLKGGRKAWITLPNPFFESDKERLIAQINLVYADDANEDVSHEMDGAT